MAFQQIVGQDHVIQLLQNGLRSDTIGHAYCFLGPEKEEKKRVALELAKALNCPQSKTDSCGSCSSCTLIEKGNHPDVLTVIPDGAVIKITQIRQLQRSSAYKITEGTTKVIILEDAESITVQAANSLLCFLEEPMNRVVLILMVENLHLLLPTIVSRCQVVRFEPKNEERIAQELQEKGVSPSQAAMFSFLRKEVDPSEYLDEGSFAALCQQVIEWNEEIFSGKSFALVALQKEWLQKELEKNKGTMVLDILLVWLRDSLNGQINRFADQKGFIFSVWNDKKKQNRTTHHLLVGLEAVLHARRQLSRYIQPQSVLEQMVLVIQEELLRGKSDRSPL